MDSLQRGPGSAYRRERHVEERAGWQAEEVCQPRPGQARQSPASWQRGPPRVCQPSPRQARQAGKEARRKFASLAPASPASWQRGPPGVCQPRPGKPGNLAKRPAGSLPASSRPRQVGKEARREFPRPGKPGQPGKEANRKFAQPRPGKPGNLAKEGPSAVCQPRPGKPATWQRGPPRVCQLALASLAKLANAAREDFASQSLGSSAGPILPAGPGSLASSAGPILPVCRPCRGPRIPGKFRRAHLASLPLAGPPIPWQAPPGPSCQFAGPCQPKLPFLANSAGPILPICQPCQAKLPALANSAGPILPVCQPCQPPLSFACLPALPACLPARFVKEQRLAET